MIEKKSYRRDYSFEKGEKKLRKWKLKLADLKLKNYSDCTSVTEIFKGEKLAGDINEQIE